MFTLAQVATALDTLHAIHLHCYHNPTLMLACIVLALVTGLLGMYVFLSCPYRQACSSRVSMSAQMVNGMPVIFVVRETYVVQF